MAAEAEDQVMAPATFDNPASARATDIDAAGATPIPEARTDHKRVMRVERWDALKKAERTSSGFLRVEGRIARVGIQTYQDADGKTRRELRPPDEVFDSEAIKSFQQVPVTNSHPPGLLNPQSVKHFAVGAVGEDVRKDDDRFVAAPFVIYDAAAISSVESGRTQLSCGYSCELDETPGEWNGEKYDAVQRKIRGNHLAIVDAARGGPELTMRLDAAGNSVVPSDSGPTIHTEKQPMATKIRVDGMAIEMNDANAETIQAAIDKAVAAATARADAAEKARDNAREVIVDLQTKLDAAAAKKVERAGAMEECDECDGTGKVDGEKCENCDGTGEVSADESDENADAKRKDSINRRIARGVRHRVGLEIEARRHLGADAKLDGMSDTDVKRAVVVKLAPKAKLDGMPPEYVNARFDAEIHHVAEQPSAVDVARAAASPFAAPRSDAAMPIMDPMTARQKMIERLHNAHKAPSAS